MKSNLALILLLYAAALSCHESPTSPGGSVPFSTVWQEQRSGLRTPMEAVVTTKAGWDGVWAQIVSDRSPKPPEPPVDFSSSSLIVVGRGEVGDACRSIEIEKVELHDGVLRVVAADHRPPMSCVCPPMAIQPVHVVAVPRTAEQVSVTYHPLTVGGPCT